MSKDKYGFRGGINLPVLESRSAPKDLNMANAIKAANELGFISREPSARLKPGPRQAEPQSKISIPGPKRVIDRYRAFCAEQNLTLWQGMEQLLNSSMEHKKYNNK